MMQGTSGAVHISVTLTCRFQFKDCLFLQLKTQPLDQLGLWVYGSTAGPGVLGLWVYGSTVQGRRPTTGGESKSDEFLKSTPIFIEI